MRREMRVKDGESMTNATTIPEEDWQLIQSLSERIMRREWEQQEDTDNLNNLLHALHGEGVRNRKYTKNEKPAVFKDGKWIER